MEDTGTAAAQPEDYVRRFISDLENPEVFLRTEYQQGGECKVWATTSWGDAGKAAILAALRKSTT